MQQNKPIPVLVDVDTGCDDAIALILAVACKNLNILGATTVSGNVDVENTTRNTLNLLHALGRGDIPVAKGAAGPIERPLLQASMVHGPTGLRGYDFEKDQLSAFVDKAAWDFMNEILMASAEKVTLVALGPVTNLAILFDKYPACKDKVKEILFMGTSYHDGNPSPVATFNVIADPEAFRRILFSGIPVIACPLETTRKGFLAQQDIEQIGALPGRVPNMAYRILRNYGVPTQAELDLLKDVPRETEYSDYRLQKSIQAKDKPVHDATTVAYLAAPELFTGKKYYCDVECSGELTTGFTLIDMADYYHKPDVEKNLLYLDSVDREGFVRILIEAIQSYPLD